MGYWNYRLVRDRDIYGDYFVTVHEVHYDMDGKVKFWTENACSPFGDNEVDLLSDLLKMARAVTFPVLDLAELQGYYSGDETLDNGTDTVTIDLDNYIDRHKN